MTVYRPFTEKLGGTDPATFVGNAGELFYNADTQQVFISDGSTPGGVPIAGGGGSIPTLDQVLSQGAESTTTAVIPFLYSSQASFPNAGTYHGAIAHSHADGAMYFAHSGVWNKLANDGTLTDGTSTLTFDSNNNISIDTSIIPDTNNAYDLGSAEYKFRDLYLSDATIHMDSQKLSAENIDRSMEVYSDPAPISSTSEGKKGDVRFDGKYMYVCVDTDKWVRSAIETNW